VVSITEQEAHALVKQALQANGANALVLAEMQGIGTHGFSRLSLYSSHLRNGRVDGNAVPVVMSRKPAALVVDARFGLAFPACELAVAEAMSRAKEHGIAFAGVINSHHCGVLVNHLHPLQDAGMVGLAFANAPSAMPAAGGRSPIFGTNPIAALFSRKNAPPLEIDMALSEVARGKLMVASQKKESIPIGWAVDKDGNATTDPQAGLDGAMLAFGSTTSPKGALLALMVEVLVTALIGTNFSHEASSILVPEGNRPQLGHAFLVIDPDALAGQRGYFERLEVLIEVMLQEDSVRLPGERRRRNVALARTNGIQVSSQLHEALVAAGRAVHG
jgi:(2R)-3-sulfolactate dehydrogenase (NADP+)